MGSPKGLSSQNTPNDSPDNSLHNSLNESFSDNVYGIQITIENCNREMEFREMEFREIDFMKDVTTVL
jgi:hypothetical protein